MDANIRFLHACSNPNIFDVYLKDCILCPNFSYFDYTDYHPIAHGHAKFKVCPPKKQYSILDAYTYVAQNSYQTAVVTGINGDLSFFVVPDAYIPITYNQAFVRFVNLAPNTELDFFVSNGSSAVFTNIEYKRATNYSPLHAGTYNFTARLTKTNQIFVTLRDVQLSANRFYTIYIFGFTRDSTSPGYLLFRDGPE